jgi:hypothetical protein
VTEIEPEFYAGPKGAELGDPATDRFMTIRLEPPFTWERRHDPAARRALKVGRGPLCWSVFTLGADGPTEAEWRSDEQVMDWPVQHFLEAMVAGKKLHGPLQPGRSAGEQRHERGDMDVDAFLGGRTDA